MQIEFVQPVLAMFVTPNEIRTHDCTEWKIISINIDFRSYLQFGWTFDRAFWISCREILIFSLFAFVLIICQRKALYLSIYMSMMRYVWYKIAVEIFTTFYSCGSLEFHKTVLTGWAPGIKIHTDNSRMKWKMIFYTLKKDISVIMLSGKRKEHNKDVDTKFKCMRLLQAVEPLNNRILSCMCFHMNFIWISMKNARFLNTWVGLVQKARFEDVIKQNNHIIRLKCQRTF